jgi:hypothetical protein
LARPKEDILEDMRHNRLSFCNLTQLRLSGSCLGLALWIAASGASVALNAQEPTSLTVSFPVSTPESSSITPPTDATPAETIAAADLPDAPSALLDPQTTQSTSAQQPVETTNPDAVSANGTQQTKRILGIMPNFRSVSADIKLPPLSAKDKFIIAGKDTFDYSSFFIAGIQAGFAMNGNSYPEFHQGLKGYGRYYWHTLADTIDENFMVGGLGPIVFKQDNRFYTLGHGGFRKRAVYAFTRVLISRSDDGNAMPNFAEVIGSGAAAGVSTLYYPTKYRTWTKVGQKWLTSDLIDGANFLLKEFWPDINKAVFHTH